MLWLIEANFPSTGQFHLRNRTPSRFFNLRALHTFLSKCRHLRFQAVAHEIEFRRAILSGRVECGFPRRQRKDQPAVARIHRLEPENVAEEGAVRFCIFAVNNDVSARDHLPLLRSASPTKERYRSEDRPLQGKSPKNDNAETPRPGRGGRRAQRQRREEERRNKTSLPQPSVCPALPTAPAR